MREIIACISPRIFPFTKYISPSVQCRPIPSKCGKKLVVAFYYNMEGEKDEERKSRMMSRFPSIVTRYMNRNSANSMG